MNYAVMVLSIGLVGGIAVTNMQASAVPAQTTLLSALSPASTPSAEITGSVAATGSSERKALRFIDLRNGASCKVAEPIAANGDWKPVPLGPDCAKSAELAKAAYWRVGLHGTLVMADNAGRTVLEFSPGDGVLYESVYPETALITVVPAKS